MSIVFAKDKRKRPRTSSNEGNNSLVRGVSISRWFSGASSSANGSAPTDSTDSQDEPTDSPVQPPPSKRVCTPTATSKYTNNYGLNDSFMKNVTQRMSGLLPATITKWFSSPSSANGSAPQAESTDSSTEDEAPEPPPPQLQPQQAHSRICYTTSAGKYSSTYVINDVISTPESSPMDLTEATEASAYSVVQSPPSRATFRRETNIVSTPLRSEEPQRADRETTIVSPQLTVSQIGRSVEKKRKSLFGNNSPAPTDASLEPSVKTLLHPIKDREPCFKASLLGSPFYPGRTMYGGASSSLYLNQPNIKQRKTAVVQETNDTDVSISSATRRVMDLLEHYSSPLIEAKRIPQYTTSPVDRSIRNKSIASYKTQELTVAQPGVASMLRLKQRHKLQSSMADVRQIIASQSSTCPYPLHTATTSEKDNFTSKVKSRVTASRPKRGDSIEEMPTPLELPSGRLHIDNLPKFSFSTPLPSQTTTNFRATKLQTVTSKITETSKLTALTSDSFKFANPVSLPSVHTNDEEKSQKFSFGSPDRDVDKRNTTIIYFVGSKDPTSDGWKCNDCWVNNNTQANKCICCGGARPVAAPMPSKCTICKLADSQENNNKCLNCNKAAAKNTSSTLIASDLKWKCADCWVSNNEKEAKCVCCGGKNPNMDSSTAGTSGVVSMDAGTEWRCNDCGITNKKDLDKCVACGRHKYGANKDPSISTNVFKMPVSKLNSLNTESSKTSDWRCGDCWVNNKSEIDKCVACGGNRPGAKPEATVTVAKINNLQDTTKPQAAKWECQSCLVRNENDALKCVCCEGAKPGTIKEADKKMFNFGVTPNTSFKFGIDPVKKPEAAMPAETIKLADVSKKLESETNNNSLANTPTFSFGIPKKPEASNTSSSEKPKVQFTFGIPKQQTDTVDSAKTDLSTSLDTRKTSSENNDKEQVVPKLTTSSEQAKSTPATFTLTPVTLNSLANPASTSPSLLTSGSTQETKDAQSKTLLMSAAKVESPPSFTFSAGAGIKMFGAPASTDVTVSAVTTPVTTTSLFSKLEAPASTTVSMFSLTSTTTSAAAAPPASVPVFGFGTANTAPATTEAKPSFTFTFGSNKTETPMFKPPPAFGAIDSSKSTKFSLPATTSVVSNASPASTIANNDSLPTSNIFGSNLPKTNELFMSPTNATPAATMFTAPSSNDSALAKSATFSFGSSPFNATTTQAPAFGNSASTNATPTFGVSAATNATSAFGTNPTTNSTPTFGVSATTNATPAFGASSTSNAAAPFGSNISANAAPAFGAPGSNLPAFGAQTTASIFGASQTAAAPATLAFGAGGQSPFGLPSQNSNNQASLFSSSTTASSPFGGQTTTNPSTNLFGSPAANPAPVFGSGAPSFGAPSTPAPAFGAPAATPTFGSPGGGVAASPAFGALNTSIPSFKAPAQTPAPAFNFGAPQQSPAVFGFGQQQQQPGIYSFGAAPGASPVQFNMGTGPSAGGMPNTAVRKFRKATRRSTTLR